MLLDSSTFWLIIVALGQVSAAPSLQSVTLQNKQAPADDSVVLGDWRGDSICQVRQSACHDEDSLYQVGRLVEKPGWFSLKADKIVDAKPVTMGTVECTYAPAKRALTCEFAVGVFQFTVQGNRMEGTMTLRDGTLWRKINLKKVGSTKLGFYPTRSSWPRHSLAPC
jgi:hypothetical protein